jgi:hypothetical protein
MVGADNVGRGKSVARQVTMGALGQFPACDAVLALIIIESAISP